MKSRLILNGLAIGRASVSFMKKERIVAWRAIYERE
jgi:hypothetical protein